MSSSTGPTRCGEGSPTIAGAELTRRDRQRLLQLARATLQAHLAGRALPPLPDDALCGRLAGAFVTIRVAGALRGCLGRLAADRPLGAIVRAMTVAAARDDPRFAPVTAEELPALTLEISVLRQPAPFAPVDPGRLVIGRDGLIVRRGRRTALLLPQVAAEHGWDGERFLGACCRKADLPPDAWREPGIDVLTFQAEVFEGPGHETGEQARQEGRGRGR